MSNPKAKITEFDDELASKIRVRTKYFFIRCTRTTNLRSLGTQAGMLGSLKGSPKFSFGRPICGLGTLTKMLGSPKGCMKFSLEHSLESAMKGQKLGLLSPCRIFPFLRGIIFTGACVSLALLSGTIPEGK